MAQARNSRGRAYAVAALALLIMMADLIATLHSMRGNPYWPSSTDIGIHQRAARAIARGTDPYAAALYRDMSIWRQFPFSPYAYPPVFAALLAPLMGFGAMTARLIWLVVSVASVVGGVLLLLRSLVPHMSWPYALLAAAAVMSTPQLHNDLYHGQANELLIGLLIVGLWALSRHRPIVTGLVWGLMIAIKPFTGVLLLYLLWRRSWRGAAVTAVTAGGLVLCDP